mmetsp:Transcript_20901/g.53967  ORF Transcript_20901/g.53967 Transcript_20901/m.53967 type:complete len:475 (-) Transcript_20901:1256-2680(-)
MRLEEHLLDRSHFLRTTPCFHFCQEVDLLKLSYIAEPLSLPIGTTLVKEGDAPSGFYVIRSGNVAVFLDRKASGTKGGGATTSSSYHAGNSTHANDRQDGARSRVHFETDASATYSQAGVGSVPKKGGMKKQREDSGKEISRLRSLAALLPSFASPANFVTEFGKGALVGEAALVRECTEPCTVVAVTPVSAFWFNRTSLMAGGIMVEDILVALRQSALLKDQVLKYRKEDSSGGGGGKRDDRVITSSMGVYTEDSSLVFGGESGSERDELEGPRGSGRGGSEGIDMQVHENLTSSIGGIDGKGSLSFTNGMIESKDQIRKRHLETLRLKSLSQISFSSLPPAPTDLKEESGLTLKDDFLKGGFTATVERRRRPEVRPRTGVVLVKMIPPGATPDDLTIFFAGYGVRQEDVIFCSTSYKHSSVPLDAFVCFASVDDAQSALEMDGHTILYKPVKVELSSEVAMQAYREKVLKRG